MKAPFLLPALLVLTSCAAWKPLPRFAISIPEPFDHHTRLHTFRQGTPLPDQDPSGHGNLAAHPTAIVSGQCVSASFASYAGGGYGTGAEQRGWTVEVESGASDQVVRALQARDGYEAKLGHNLGASARIYPRFAHKHFSWGEAVSFLVQYDNGQTNYVPNNGMLYYEVHGVTHDRRQTVRATFGITHPQLVEIGRSPLRNYRSDSFRPGSPIRRDPDYRLVERCPDAAFQPSIKAIDAMLDTLKPEVLR